MSFATTVCFYERACARQRWEVLDRYNIVTHAFACSYFSGPLWALSGGQGL